MRRVIFGLVRFGRVFSAAPRTPLKPPNFLLQPSTCILPVRTMSGDRKIDLSYEDLLELKAQGGIVLVDVREHKEIQETGKLPGSIHIPLGELQQALKSSADEFKKKYEGADLPTKTSELVFSCKGGMRSRKAMAAAQEVGFTNVRHYAGGWLDWEAKTKN
ncbi:thiosulfate sulfurtransferase/rhodanese-like domain-containing protein 3 [Cloeon dipterum]|uniref:thiosulfate sulfurtransferase/rhodanese-like domain-containing protein 3 n=1 Tax=Cloeon dipterum TaxID=197152 RepID=UPI00321F8C36